MKFVYLALIASVSAIDLNRPSARVSGEEGIYRPRPYTYTYNDIRDKELKCVADRNREWHYYANNNTWECPLKAYPWASSGQPSFWAIQRWCFPTDQRYPHKANPPSDLQSFLRPSFKFTFRAWNLFQQATRTHSTQIREMKKPNRVANEWDEEGNV